MGPGAFETSKVDTSPLEQLKGGAFNDPDELQLRLETLSFISNANAETPENGIGDYDFGSVKGRVWARGYTDGPTTVVAIYDTPENASSAFQLLASNNNHSQGVTGKRKTVIISKNIKAVLNPAYQFRSVDLLWAYIGERHLDTEVQIGNVVLDYHETSDSAADTGIYTSQNLKQICQALGQQVDVLGSSSVTTSVLAPFAHYPDYSLDELQKKLNQGNVTNEDMEYVSGQNQKDENGKLWRYQYRMVSLPISNGADIFLTIYDTSQDAARALGQSKVSQIKPKAVVISENVDTILGPVFNFRQADNTSGATSQKHLLTKVRISNMVLDFSEYSNSQQAIGSLTNEGLKQICTALETH